MAELYRDYPYGELPVRNWLFSYKISQICNMSNFKRLKPNNKVNLRPISLSSNLDRADMVLLIEIIFHLFKCPVSEKLTVQQQ